MLMELRQQSTNLHVGLAFKFKFFEFLFCELQRSEVCSVLDQKSRIDIDKTTFNAQCTFFERSHLLVTHSHVVQDHQNNISVTASLFVVELLI
jgi:hypothetical protein